MYSDGSEFLPQNNETALKYFKKASELVGINITTSVRIAQDRIEFSLAPLFIRAFLLLREIQWDRMALAWPTCMEEASRW